MGIGEAFQIKKSQPTIKSCFSSSSAFAVGHYSGY
jgi:hypothetical protein